MSFKGKTVFITGGSRGIGKAIALRLAKDGANIAIAAKTTEPHPKLEGTIFTAAEEIRALGGNALPVKTDIRFEEEVLSSMEKTVAEFGGLDILINNASAISLGGTEMTSMKRYDLMHGVNVRGTFLCSKCAIPYLKKSDNPQVLNIAPPLNMDKKWFASHVAYTMAKYGMSMCVLGMAEEFRSEGIAFNALWPKTTIATAAVENVPGGEAVMKMSRKPEIMAEAAAFVLAQSSKEHSGNFYVDEDVLVANGYNKEMLEEFAVNPGGPLIPDFFL